MKYGIYYAYWETEWEANYAPYVEKVAKLGFDILEVGAKPLPDYTKEQIRELRQCAADHGITLTAGYGPPTTTTWDQAIRLSAPTRQNGLSGCSM